MNLDTGIHLGIPEAAYHADPAIEPSASSSILRLITDRSPLHAYTAHPRLGADPAPRASTAAQNAGTILHSLVLDTPRPFVVQDVEAYRTKEDRAARDAATAAGLIPVKRADMQERQDTAASVRARLQAMPEVWAAMQDAVAERMTEATLIWREAGVLCRCRYDTLPAARFGASYDLKFVSRTAEPDAIGRTILNDYLIQADLYPRAVKALRGDNPTFIFVACETEEPFGVTLHALAPDLADIARQRVDTALGLWRTCLREDRWPGYSPHVHWHEAPGWMLARHEERAQMVRALGSNNSNLYVIPSMGELEASEGFVP